jgi:predicted phage terminase large subunit-like protein
MSEIANKIPDGVINYTDPADLGSDFLCSPIGYRFGPYTYITDVVFTQDPVEVTEPLVAKMLIRNKCQYSEMEINAAGRSFLRNVKKILDNQNYYCPVVERKTVQNKETRILMQSGYIKEYFFFRNDYKPGSDYDKYMRQLTGYVKLGRNTHDDAADGTTGLAEMIPYRKFSKPIAETQSGPGRRVIKFNSDDDYLGGEVTQEYLDFIGGC